MSQESQVSHFRSYSPRWILPCWTVSLKSETIVSSNVVFRIGEIYTSLLWKMCDYEDGDNRQFCGSLLTCTLRYVHSVHWVCYIPPPPPPHFINVSVCQKLAERESGSILKSPLPTSSSPPPSPSPLLSPSPTSPSLCPPPPPRKSQYTPPQVQ